MIIQGTNIPIEIEVDEDVNSYRDFVATLWIQGKQVKKWQKTEGTMIVDGTSVKLPLDEDETRDFKKGKAKLLVKGLNFYNEIIFWDEATIEIMSRDDREEDLIP